MVEAEIKYWEENQDELWGAINTEYWKKIEDWDYSVSTEGRVINNNTNKYLKSYPNKKKDPKGSVSICKNSWRVRVTLKNGDRWSKSVKTEEIGNQVKDYIIENVKNDNIKNKDDADEYYKLALNYCMFSNNMMFRNSM